MSKKLNCHRLCARVSLVYFCFVLFCFVYYVTDSFVFIAVYM